MPFGDIDKPVVKVDKVTRQVVATYANYAEAGRSIGIKPNHAQLVCNRRHVPSHSRFYIRYEEDFDPDEEISLSANTPVYAIRGNRLRTFTDAWEASEVMGITLVRLSDWVNRPLGVDGVRWGRLTMGLPKLLRMLEAGDA